MAEKDRQPPEGAEAKPPAPPEAEGYAYHAFFSYPEDAQREVQGLIQCLEEAGCRIWDPHRDIPWGASILGGREEALRTSRHLVVFLTLLLSESSLETLARESAQFRDPANHERTLLPVQVGDCDIPQSLAHLRVLKVESFGELDAHVPEMVKTLLGSAKASAAPAHAHRPKEGCRTFLKERFATFRPYPFDETFETRALYIEPTFRETSPTTSPKGSARRGRRHSLRDLLKAQTDLIILGDAGSGRTLLCQWICLQEAQEGTQLAVPIRVRDLKAEDWAPGPGFSAGILSHLRRVEMLPPEAADDLKIAADAGHLTLLLDGLDEALSHTAEALKRFIQCWKSVSTRPRILATSRSSGFVVPSGLEAFKRWTVEPLQDEDRLTLLHRLIPARARQISNQLDDDPQLQALSGNPYILTALAWLVNAGHLPEDLGRREHILHILVRELFDRWNRRQKRPTPAHLAERLVWRWLRGLALKTLREGEMSFTLHTAQGHWERLECEGPIEDALKMIGLLRGEGPERFGFVHGLLQETLAAQALLELGDHGLREMCERPWVPKWRSVLRLAVGQLREDGVREGAPTLLRLLNALLAEADTPIHSRLLVAGQLLGMVDDWLSRSTDLARLRETVDRRLSPLIEDDPALWALQEELGPAAGVAAAQAVPIDKHDPDLDLYTLRYFPHPPQQAFDIAKTYLMSGTPDQKESSALFLVAHHNQETWIQPHLRTALASAAPSTQDLIVDALYEWPGVLAAELIQDIWALAMDPTSLRLSDAISDILALRITVTPDQQLELVRRFPHLSGDNLLNAAYILGCQPELSDEVLESLLLLSTSPGKDCAIHALAALVEQRLPIQALLPSAQSICALPDLPLAEQEDMAQWMAQAFIQEPDLVFEAVLSERMCPEILRKLVDRLGLTSLWGEGAASPLLKALESADPRRARLAERILLKHRHLSPQHQARLMMITRSQLDHGSGCHRLLRLLRDQAQLTPGVVSELRGIVLDEGVEGHARVLALAALTLNTSASVSATDLQALVDALWPGLDGLTIPARCQLLRLWASIHRHDADVETQLWAVATSAQEHGTLRAIALLLSAPYRDRLPSAALGQAKVIASGDGQDTLVAVAAQWFLNAEEQDLGLTGELGDALMRGTQPSLWAFRFAVSSCLDVDQPPGVHLAPINLASNRDAFFWQIWRLLRRGLTPRKGALTALLQSAPSLPKVLSHLLVKALAAQGPHSKKEMSPVFAWMNSSVQEETDLAEIYFVALPEVPEWAFNAIINRLRGDKPSPDVPWRILAALPSLPSEVLRKLLYAAAAGKISRHPLEKLNWSLLSEDPKLAKKLMVYRDSKNSAARSAAYFVLQALPIETLEWLHDQRLGRGV